MTKTLNLSQLLSSIKKQIPKGNLKGATIISLLVKRGILHQTGEHKYDLAPGVKPTTDDVTAIVAEMTKKRR
ncbi:hypothetical protein NIES4074_24130 [Cylindrospermum sp. NIES-4074]|nr:hypothetical protein NIES4074_24130 [Cylindrospermum sp. NIES-4074]